MEAFKPTGRLLIMPSQTHPSANRLLARKKAIEVRIAEELKRPLPDPLELQSLKRARLSLEDHIHRLMMGREYDVTPTPVRIA
jgi:hypothetical protein